MAVWKLQKQGRLRQQTLPEPLAHYSAALTTTLI